MAASERAVCIAAVTEVEMNVLWQCEAAFWQVAKFREVSDRQQMMKLKSLRHISRRAHIRFSALL